MKKIKMQVLLKLMVHWLPFYESAKSKMALGCNLISILVLASLILRTTPIPINLPQSDISHCSH